MLQNGGAATADTLIKDTTTQSFMKDVIEESKHQPVLVDFWAPWCGPCKQLTPLLEKAVSGARGRVKLVKMNIDEHPAVAQQLGIQSIPAVVAFAAGRPADAFMGALPESQITEFIDRLTKGAPAAGEDADLIKEAEAALIEGDAPGAAALFAQVLGADPGNVTALAGLARCYIETDALELAAKTLALVPEAKRGDAAVSAAQAMLELAEQAKTLGPLSDLETKVAANPLDHQARFDLALALAAAGRRPEAVTHLVDIVRRDRKWNDDGARKQLVQFFEAWGPMDEATVEGRKKLSSVLFA